MVVLECESQEQVAIDLNQQSEVLVIEPDLYNEPSYAEVHRSYKKKPPSFDVEAQKENEILQNTNSAEARSFVSEQQ